MIKATRIETAPENTPETRDFSGFTRETVEHANEALRPGIAKLARKPLRIETLNRDLDGKVGAQTEVREEFFVRLAELAKKVRPASEQELQTLTV